MHRVLEIPACNLCRAHLKSLFSHESIAIVAREFLSSQAAENMATEITQKYKNNECSNWRVNTLDNVGMESSDVLTIGTPFNVAISTDTGAYFDEVRKTALRERSSGRPNPSDLLRLELDDLWPRGCAVGREEGGDERGKSSGQVRVMPGPTSWKDGFVHVDDFSGLSVRGGTFSGNVYLQLPSNGNGTGIEGAKDGDNNNRGHLQIWDVDVTSDDFRNAENGELPRCLASQDARSQVRLRKHLGQGVNVGVGPGDLVLLCTQRPHAVVGFEEGLRISYQSFIEYRGEGEQLVIDG